MRITRKRTGPASERTPRSAIFSRRVTPLVLVVLLTPAAAVARADDPPPAPTASQATAPLSVDPSVDPVPAAATTPTTGAETKSTPAGPPPPHTGVKATLKAIPGDFRHLPSRHSLAVIAGGGALALAAGLIARKHPLGAATILAACLGLAGSA